MASPSPPDQSYLATPHGDATHIPLDIFLHSILPPLQRNLDVSQILDRLRSRERKSFSLITLRGRWRGFPEDPRNSRSQPHKVFLPLRNVVDSILKADGSGKIPSSFYQNPTAAYTIYASHRKSSTLPDAYFSHRPVNNWSDIATFGEYQKGDTQQEILENIMKVTNSMHRCMKDDPRRRFAYSFTIENTSMRLWFCDRTRIIVSEPFNFITDHLPMVHFVLSLAYANAEALGLDPTMTPSDDGESYNVTVCSQDGRVRTYRTQGLLSYTGTELHSRVTRVWKAIHIEDGQEVGEAVVLKDTWVNHERSSEGDILAELIGDQPEEDRAKIRDFFPAIECHGKVYLDKERTKLDDARAFAVDEDSVEESDTGSRPSWYRTVTRRGPFHYRIVFRDVCKPLDKETSLSAIFHALSQTAIALRAMHSAGWIHRDVSPGNILLKDNNQTLLADLELAKRVGSGDEHKLGTSSFMAVEIASQSYEITRNFVLPSSDFDVTEAIDRIIKRGIAERDGLAPPSPLPQNKDEYKIPPFQYNPLHDLEALWWVAAYFVVVREIVRPGYDPNSDPSESVSQAQQEYARKLFTNYETRLWTVKGYDKFLQDTKVLPAHTNKLILALDRLRQDLYNTYRDWEYNFEEPEGGWVGALHDIFVHAFKVISNAEEIQPLMVRPFLRRAHDSEDITVDRSQDSDLSISSQESKKRGRDVEEAPAAAEEESGRRSKKAKVDIPRREYLPRRAKERPKRS